MQQSRCTSLSTWHVVSALHRSLTLCCALALSCILTTVSPLLPLTLCAPGKSVEETEQLLAECREVLFKAREQRPRPHRDDKARGDEGGGVHRGGWRLVL